MKRTYHGNGQCKHAVESKEEHREKIRNITNLSKTKQQYI